jgi:hypothetical protein
MRASSSEIRNLSRSAGFGLHKAGSQMQNIMDIILKADNCATAALGSYNQDDRQKYIQLSAAWRNEALRIGYGEHAQLLSCCTFTEDQLIVV